MSAMLFGPPHPRAELSDYVDGRLDHRARERLERHLARCAACQGELETLRQTVALLRALPSAEPARSFALRAAPVRVGAPRRGPLWPALPALAAGLAAVLVVAAASGLLWPAVFTPDGSAPLALAPAREAAPALPGAAAAPQAAPARRAGPAAPAVAPAAARPGP
ncbi:MAG: zf-HC2 domain-containing protein, partial [Chloroflexi bacterium]|nr:zf-HC2 domain-containing protein [Chloroflexota bacterium]